MKKTFTVPVLFIALATLLLISSCSSSNNEIKHIPSDALFVGVVNTPEIGVKSQLHKDKSFAFISNLVDMTEQSQEHIAVLLHGILEEKQESGIHILKPFFFYTQNEGADINIIIPLADDTKFGNYIEKNLSDTFTKITQNDIIVYTDEKGNSIAYNEHSAFIITSDNYSIESIVTLFNISKENSIAENDEFLEFFDESKDMALFMQTNLLLESNSSIQKQVKSSLTLFDYSLEELKDSYISFNLNFKSDNIELTTLITGDEDFEALVSENSLTKPSFSDDVLSYVPEKTLFFTAGTFDPEKLLQYIKKLDNRNNIISLLEKNDIAAKALIQDFEGDFAISLYNFSTESFSIPRTMFKGLDENGKAIFADTVISQEKTIPQITAALSLHNSQNISLLFDQFGQNFLEKKGDYYIFKQSATLGMNSYICLTDNMLVLSTDKNAIEKALEGGFDENFTSNKQHKNITSAGYVFANLDYESYPKGLKSISEKMGIEHIIQEIAPLVQSLEIKSENNMSSSVILNLQNDDENSLYQVLHTVDEFSGL
ncbi:MAG: DUF4836 family protein [Bacteroidales bacterium]